jgi:hypothetical protein
MAKINHERVMKTLSARRRGQEHRHSGQFEEPREVEAVSLP